MSQNVIISLLEEERGTRGEDKTFYCGCFLFIFVVFCVVDDIFGSSGLLLL